MPSLSYGDYRIRLAESRVLLRDAMRSIDAVRTAALCKGAVVLAAAALERYVNDVVNEASRQVKVADWSALSEGQQRYMSLQVAGHLYQPVERVYVQQEVNEASRNRLHSAIVQGMSALISPAAWAHESAYGQFLDGAAEVAKLDQVLKMFHERGIGLFDFIENRAGDRGALARGIQGLIDARHQAAHALTGASPSPKDARTWILLSALVARTIETFLSFRDS